MCGACGVRPPADWYEVGVPSDPVGRAASLRRLKALVEAALPGRGARVSLTLAGTALLVSSPTGGSKLVTGVPDAIGVIESLFGAVPDGIDVDRTIGAAEVAAPIPESMGWESFAWWFSLLSAARRTDLVSATAVVDTSYGPISLEYADGTTRAQRCGDASLPREVRLAFSPLSAAPTPDAIRRTLEDLTTRPVVSTDRLRKQ